MKVRIPLTLLALSLVAASGVARGEAACAKGRRISPVEANRLRSMEESSLVDLRAGAVTPPVAIRGGERTVLREAQRRSPDLERMKAGNIEISDQEFKVIVIVLGVLLVLALI
jgi:hypothetical protein